MVSINKAQEARFELVVSVNFQWAINAHNAIIGAISATRDRVLGMANHAHDHVLIRACQTRQAIAARKTSIVLGIRHKASSVRDTLLAAALGIPAESIPELRARILNPVPVVPVPASADAVSASADAVSAPKRATARKAKSYPIDIHAESGMNVNAEQFRQALDRVSKAIPKRGRPILQAVYLRAEGSELVMSGTDWEVSAVTRIPAVIADFKSAIINCADLKNALKGAKGTINLYAEDDDNVTLKIGSRTITLAGFPIEEYPKYPALESAWQEVPAGFLSGIGKVLPAALTKDPNEILTGIHMQASRLVSTDTHRGFIAQLRGELVDWPDCIVPARVMAMLAKVLDAKEGDSLQVRCTENLIEFRHGASSLASRLIEGHFPNIDKVIPDDYSGSWAVNRVQLIEAVNGLSPIALENCNRLAISSNGTELIITASAETDSASAKVPAVCAGTWHEFTLGFNCRYLLDALKVQDSEQVTIEGNGEVQPVVIGMDPFTITMPIDLKN